MRYRLTAILMLILTLLLSGCGMRTVEQMYAIPRRSQEFQSFQGAVDIAMRDMEYAAPVAGENRQSLQYADLNGDGTPEYLVFARDSSGKNLRILVFYESGEHTFSLGNSLEVTGASFDQVSYGEIDDAPGLELVVGTQISNQMMGNAVVFSFSGEEAEQILSSSYSRMVSADLDEDGFMELLLIRRSEAEGNASACLYDYQDGGFHRSRDLLLSQRAEDIRRIKVSSLASGETGVYISGFTPEESVITDVLASLSGSLVNVAASGDMGMGFQPMLDYSVFCEDIDADGVLEFPNPVLGLEGVFGDTGSCMIDWYALNASGEGVLKSTTFHDYTDGWFVRLESTWVERIALKWEKSGIQFSLRGDDDQNRTLLFSIFAFSGRDKETRASAEDLTVLARTENTLYAARLESGAAGNGVNQTWLNENFQIIPKDK